ncbi:putative oxidoreductase YtkK [Alicyclobacillus cellulosilyticus]|uniref:Oxidoreductase YtkK n=1 Tax=Alicyclobacillus cellulosilyticus TaxID=1003997 RepID=A0A917KAN4_9BACL|nr:SDR family oxidoreductase [Alicyclobacillus cellulosilyticus]GGJ06678.1 putative oxidoreductase YtkK [Alicyclobacillus cellulosilyticus]
MSGRVAFVTSGARGLGHATVRALFAAGWDVFFTFGKSEQEAANLIAEAERLGRRAGCRRTDLFNPHQVRAALHACEALFGRVDAVVHNFGPFVFERVALADYTDDMWRMMADGNLTNFFWLYRDAVPGMRARRFGRFVTLGFDGAGRAAGWAWRAPYAAAKSALASLTRSIAREEREHGITANMVCPGDIRGEAKMQRIVEAPRGPDGRRLPVGEDVGRVVAFLCSEESAYINGTVIEVTGGEDVLGIRREGRDARDAR